MHSGVVVVLRDSNFIRRVLRLAMLHLFIESLIKICKCLIRYQRHYFRFDSIKPVNRVAGCLLLLLLCFQFNQSGVQSHCAASQGFSAPLIQTALGSLINKNIRLPRLSARSICAICSGLGVLSHCRINGGNLLIIRSNNLILRLKILAILIPYYLIKTAD